jgi:N-acetyl-alpha-D-glucosaminyl L-malate synthase BshA
VVTTLHGTDITIVGTERAYFHPIRYGICRSDAVTTVSRWLRGETERVFGCDVPIEIVPNFVSLERFRPLADSPLRRMLVPEGERVLCHVSNFRPVKRLHDVVTIFARVNEQQPSRLLLAGDGPEWAAAEETAAELGVADRVHFLGEQEGIEEVLAAADVFLLPSEHESFGLAALEAMACGVPVVATRSGGLPEVLDEGETGYLVEVGDVGTAAGRVLGLLRDEEARRRMGEAARRAAGERFAQDRVVAEYVAIYERVLAARAGA